MGNVALALELLITLAERARRLTHLLQVAHSAGRDITPEELADLRTEDDAAKADLDSAIAKAKTEEA